VLIQHGLKEVSHTANTEATAFTDGCSGLRSILVDADVTVPPFLDCFHIAIRLRHTEKTVGYLSTETPEQVIAKAMVVKQVERLHWRIWNGKAKDAKVTLERIQPAMDALQGAAGRPEKGSVSTANEVWPFRKLGAA
jgi:hypothetical protein